MSMSLNQVQLKEQASISVMKMAMDSAQGQEEAGDKLLEANTKALEQSVVLQIVIRPIQGQYPTRWWNDGR